jgi:hypothetical protein
MSIVLEHEPIGEADRTSLSAGSAAASSTAPAGSLDLLSVPPHQVVLEEIMSILASVFCINGRSHFGLRMKPVPLNSKPCTPRPKEASQNGSHTKTTRNHCQEVVFLGCRPFSRAVDRSPCGSRKNDKVNLYRSTCAKLRNLSNEAMQGSKKSLSY